MYQNKISYILSSLNKNRSKLCIFILFEASLSTASLADIRDGFYLQKVRAVALESMVDKLRVSNKLVLRKSERKLDWEIELDTAKKFETSICIDSKNFIFWIK